MLSAAVTRPLWTLNQGVLNTSWASWCHVASDPMVWVDKGSVTSTQGLLDYGPLFEQQGISRWYFAA